LSLDQADQVGSQWREGHVDYTPGNWLPITPQMLNPTPAIVGDVRFRKALLYALDRQSIADSLTHGRESVANSFMNPGQAQYRDLEARLVTYEYDPRKATAMLEGLGYTKGGDGAYHDGAGQPLSFELRAWTGTSFPYRAVVADQWRGLGIDVQE